MRNIWFEYLHTAYVQTGEYTVTETYLPGKTHTQGIQQVTPSNVVPKPYPETFSADWASMIVDDEAIETGYSTGQYGTGIPVHERTITAPQVRRVHLLYYNDYNSTRQVRRLVQVVADSDTGVDRDDAIADLGSAGLGIVTDTLGKVVFTENEYFDNFGPLGYSQFGLVLPKGVQNSTAEDLLIFTGDFWPEGSDSKDPGDVENVTVYFSHVWFDNAKPLFDRIYMQTDVADMDSNVMGIPSHLVMWFGGLPSRTTAPINREGDAVTMTQEHYDLAGNKMVLADDESTLEIDGVEYKGTDAYNMGFKQR